MSRMRMKNVAAVAFVLIITVISGAAQDRRPPDSQPAAPAQSDLIGKAVEVTVSESGKVIEARAVSGPELLREPAIRAAKRWGFSPAEAPVKGILVFTFATATHTTHRY